MLGFLPLLLAFQAGVQPPKPVDVTLDTLVTPESVFWKDEKPVTFALYGFLEFRSLKEMFDYVEAQARRWQFTPEERRDFIARHIRRGVESRVVSMVWDRPLEVLVTHTREQLSAALDRAITRRPLPPPPGLREAFLEVQAKWKKSLNCWSAASSIPGRVLSNWYPIEEGIELYGAVYDSTEHFWQAVKFHPGVTIADLLKLLDRLDSVDWRPWLEKISNDQKLYLLHTYAIEFLRANLKPERRQWLRGELRKLPPQESARRIQQRGAVKFRFTALQEKILWGDLADVFHLLFHFESPLRAELAATRFDGVYLESRKLGFISPEFQALMLEIWKVKYLKLKRFGEVIRAIPEEIRLEHYLNDGDSPDIPIPVYVRQLNQIRKMSREGAR
jgi:hypothetical protein